MLKIILFCLPIFSFGVKLLDLQKMGESNLLTVRDTPTIKVVRLEPWENIRNFFSSEYYSDRSPFSNLLSNARFAMHDVLIPEFTVSPAHIQELMLRVLIFRINNGCQDSKPILLNLITLFSVECEESVFSALSSSEIKMAEVAIMPPPKVIVSVSDKGHKYLDIVSAHDGSKLARRAKIATLPECVRLTLCSWGRFEFTEYFYTRYRVDFNEICMTNEERQAKSRSGVMKFFGYCLSLVSSDGTAHRKR